MKWVIKYLEQQQCIKTVCFEGTEDSLKSYLVQEVQKMKQEYMFFDGGTENPSEIVYESEFLVARAIFCSEEGHPCECKWMAQRVCEFPIVFRWRNGKSIGDCL